MRKLEPKMSENISYRLLTGISKLCRNTTNQSRLFHVRPKNKEQIPQFQKSWDKIKSTLVQNDDHNLRHAMRRFEQVLAYNVASGKLNRGMSVVDAYQELEEKNKLTEENIERSRILGWCVELLHNYFIIIDDLLDNSITRRGQQCWHLMPNVGLGAINDAVMLRSALFQLLKDNFKDQKCYMSLMHVFLWYCYLSEIGQSTDCLMAPDGKKIDFSMLNMSHYISVVNHKLASSFDLPIRAAMYLSSIEDEDVHLKTQNILRRIALLYQIQNDYLDLYGNPSVTGKIGTDIESGRCTWFAIESFNRMTEIQCNLFIENYGINEEESVKVIKQIYDEIKLKDAFFAFRNIEFESIKNQIRNSKEIEMNANILTRILENIYDMKT